MPGDAGPGDPGGDAAPGDAAPGDAAPGDASTDAAAGVDASTVDGPLTTELDGRITINEFMTYNAVTVLDDTGVASDWVELYNPTATDLPLAGYGLTDNLALPARAVIPAGVVLPAGGHLVLWLDHAPERGPRHLGFHLAREGGDLALTRPDGSPIDRVTYGAQAVDFSAARVPDGSNQWRVEWHATPGTANPAGPGTPAGGEVASAPPELVPAAGDLTERILGYDVVLRLEILLTPAAIAALASNPYADVPGTLVLEGRSYGPVGVRLKGQNSFQPIMAKPSLRINIDEYVPRAELFGLKDLTLNNMDNDLSMMHERLAYLVARTSGIAASRANHALLTINGGFYGLYTNVETVKRKMLTRWFANPSGALFEGTDADFVSAQVPRFELESGSDDRSLLTGLAAALTGGSPDAAIAAASAYVDLARFHDYWAMASVIGQFDALPYSIPGDDYLVYVDPATQRLTFLPWGMDESFYSPEIDVTRVHSVLATTCKASPACFQGYVNRAWALLAVTEGLNLAAERTRVAAQIMPYVALDTRKPYSTETVFAHQRAMGNFITTRRTRFMTMLPPSR